MCICNSICIYVDVYEKLQGVSYSPTRTTSVVQRIENKVFVLNILITYLINKDTHYVLDDLD